MLILQAIELINITEVANYINGDMLTENPVCATSAFGRWEQLLLRLKKSKNSIISTEKQQTLSDERQVVEGCGV